MLTMSERSRLPLIAGAAAAAVAACPVASAEQFEATLREVGLVSRARAHPPFLRGDYLVEVVRLATLRRRFTSRQVVALVERANCARDAGTQAALCCALFSRVSDLPEFYSTILAALPARVCRDVLARLGPLNVLNPLQVDGAYFELPFDYLDDRLLTLHLVTLSKAEWVERHEKAVEHQGGFKLAGVKQHIEYSGTRPLQEAQGTDAGMTAEFITEHFAPTEKVVTAKYLEAGGGKPEKKKKKKAGKKGDHASKALQLAGGHQWPPEWLTKQPGALTKQPGDRARVCACEKDNGQLGDCECFEKVGRVHYVSAAPEYKDWGLRQKLTGKFLVGARGALTVTPAMLRGGHSRADWMTKQSESDADAGAANGAGDDEASPLMGGGLLARRNRLTLACVGPRVDRGKLATDASRRREQLTEAQGLDREIQGL